MGRVDGQCRGHGLPGGALPGRGLHQLRPDRNANRHDLQGHERQRLHQLQLSRARDRRGRESQLVLEHGWRHYADAGHDAADAAGDVVRDGRVGRRGRSVLGRVDGQCRRHRLPGGALPGRGVHATSPRSPTPAGTTYKDTSVSPSTSYSYRVRATDAAGNLSSYSNTAGATTPTPDTTPPTQPGTLSAHRCLERRGRPVLGRLDRQCWCHGLHGGALPGRGVQQLRPDRDDHRHGTATRTPASARPPATAIASARPTLPAT